MKTKKKIRIVKDIFRVIVISIAFFAMGYLYGQKNSDLKWINALIENRMLHFDSDGNATLNK